MPERGSFAPACAWIVGAVLVIVTALVMRRVVQTQQHLSATSADELEGAIA
jgi:hypothetical protein